MVTSYADEVIAKSEAAQAAAVAEAGGDWWWLTFDFGVELRQCGDDLRGFSFCAKANGWLLSVRLTREGTPVVVYVNRLSPTGCVHKLRDKWRAGTLLFMPDRYA